MYFENHLLQAVAFGSDANVAALPGLSLLTDLERAVVAIGCAEAHHFGWDGFAYRSSLWRKTIGWALQALGVRPLRRLANDLLELLRLYTCMCRQGHPALTSVADRLEAMGIARFPLLQVQASMNEDRQHA